MSGGEMELGRRLAPRVLLRRRLLVLFERLEPSFVLLSAPRGYGKSTLASQLSSMSRFAVSVTVAIEDSLPSDVSVLRALCNTLKTSSCPANGHESRSELIAQSAQLLQGCSGPLCVTFDGIHAFENPEVLFVLHEITSRFAPVRSCLIVTQRQEVDSPRLADPGVWLVSATALKFTEEECREYLDVTLPDRLPSNELERVFEMSGGQPALVSVMARNLALGVEQTREAISPDVQSCYLNLLSACCSPLEQDVLFAAAMLGQGNVNDLAELVDSIPSDAMRTLAARIPLLGIDDARPSTYGTFRVHDIAQAAILSSTFRTYIGASASRIQRDALRLLAMRGRYERLFEVAGEHGTVDDLMEWLEQYGHELVGRCATGLLARCLERVPAVSLLSRPPLLMLQAHLLRMTGDMVDAERKARVALELLCDGSSRKLEQEALELLAGLCLELGRFDALDHYCELLSSYDLGEAEDARRRSRRICALVACGQFGEAQLELQELEVLASTCRESAARALSLKASAFLSAVVLGDMRAATEKYLAEASFREIDLTDALIAKGNAATTLCELGRLARADRLINEVLRQADQLELTYLRHGFSAATAAILAGQGETLPGVLELRAAIEASEALSCAYDVVMNLCFLAMLERAAGLSDDALVSAERAVELAAGVEYQPADWLASLELSASLLLLGDRTLVADRVLRVWQDASEAGCRYISTRASLISSEIERRQANRERAVEIIRESESHLLSESSNFQSAMYVRAFPGLLGVLAKAIGPERLPAHMLRMILPENAEVALPMARDILDEDEWVTLATRILGKSGARRMLRREKGLPQCRVRMFGGLEVKTDHGIVDERAWRKRKARLLFAMLAVRRGKDVPREQLFEYLWPDMNEERARNNLYVVWNAMKNALSPRETRNGEAPPYVENVGGVCRVNARLVRSDLDDFEEGLARARHAESSGDASAAASHYERLAEVYRGDLLPGDIYDDWFAPLRERYRQEFGDAMVRGAQLLEPLGEIGRALGLVRAALAFDPWREDLYQTTLRLQIGSGQRSAAIETYMACRTRLAEDLGLDPSAETRALYDEVLAMEDRPTPEPPGPEPEAAEEG